MKRNDILWKGILQDLFDDFLRFFYPDADEIFDFGKGFEFLDKELEQLFPLIDDASSTRYVDKLVKVFMKTGGEKWILVHIEVQGYTDKTFGKRMFQYYTRIFDKYDQPITAFAIFTDTNKSFHPKQYRDGVLGTKILYAFNTFKIIEQDSALLADSNNPFAMVVLSAKLTLTRKRVKDQQLFDSGRDLIKLLLSKQMPKKKIRRILFFLNRYIRFENNEMFIKFGEEIVTLTKGGIAMGIEELIKELVKEEGREEGREEARQEGKQEVNGIASKLMENGMDINFISNITGISISELEQLSKGANRRSTN